MPEKIRASYFFNKFLLTVLLLLTLFKIVMPDFFHFLLQKNNLSQQILLNYTRDFEHPSTSFFQQNVIHFFIKEMVCLKRKSSF